MSKRALRQTLQTGVLIETVSRPAEKMKDEVENSVAEDYRKGETERDVFGALNLGASKRDLYESLKTSSLSYPMRSHASLSPPPFRFLGLN